MRRIKNLECPRAPNTCEEVINLFRSEAVMAKYDFNLRGSQRFYIGGEAMEGHDFILFASMDAIKLVQDHIAPSQRNYLMDGTFKIVPRGEFRQLLIIHIEWKSDVIFLIFLLSLSISVRIRPYHYMNFSSVYDVRHAFAFMN